MAIVAHIVIEFKYRSQNMQISYDKLAGAKKDYERFKKIKLGTETFEFTHGMVPTLVDVPSVVAVSFVDKADFDKRSAPKPDAKQ